MLRTFFAAAFAWLALGSAAHAQQQQVDPQRLTIAQDIMVLLEAQSTLEGMFTDLTPLMATGITQELRLSRTEGERLTQILTEEMRAEVPALIQSMANAYAGNLSLEHLQEIRAFMQSPAGQAMNGAQNAMEQELEGVGQEMGMRVALRALTRFQQEREARR